MGILDFFSHEAGQQRRKALDETLGNLLDINRYIPPNSRDRAASMGNLLAMLNPVNDMEQASVSGRQMMAPNQNALSRFGHGLDMATNSLAVAAPVAGFKYADDAADAGRMVVDAFTGVDAMGRQAVGNMADAGRRFAADESGNVPIASITPEAQRGNEILSLLKSGNGDKVTDEMLDMGDPVANAKLNQYLFDNYDLPMDEASRMARAEAGGSWDDAYHATGRDFNEFNPSNFRGASFFGPTPEGAEKGARASANEGVGSGNGLIIPARVNTSGVEGLGAYARKDMNDFHRALDNRIYSEAEVDALMSSDAAPLRGDWTYFFDDVTDYDALRKHMDSNPGKPPPDGIIGYKPARPLHYSGDLRRDNTGRQFAHYSEGMSEKPISDYVKSQGNTGFTMQDESGLALAVTDPSTIRSRFARFDPRLKHLRNLSAGVGGAGLLSYLVDDESNQDELRNYLSM